MNRSFKSIFNRRTGTWQVVSEKTRNAGKTGSSVSKPLLAMLLGLSASTGMAQTSPIDGANTETITGTTWNVGGDLTVGSTGAGTLNIQDGGIVTNIDGTIGNAGNSNGTVTVTGPASAWDNSGYLYVGRSGTGTLTIEKGGKVTNTVAYIGLVSGSEGTVTVTGAGSVWQTSGGNNVGWYGTGTLSINDGGRVSSPFVTLGYMSGSSGTLNLNSTGNARGVLSTARVVKGVGTTAAFNWNGGILQATVNESNYLGNLASSDIVIGSNGAYFDTNTFDVGITTSLQGTGGFTKLGQGTLTLSGANTYTGTTSLNEGTLQINDESALGTGDRVVLSSGALRTTTDMTLSKRVSFSSDTSSRISAATGTTLTLSGYLDFNGNSQAHFGSAADTGIVILKPSTLAVTDSSSIWVDGGTLKSGSVSSVQLFRYASSTNVASGAILDLNSYDTTINNLQGAGLVSNDGRVTTINAGDFAGVITGTTTLIKSTTGILVLAGANDYSGLTSINAGTLSVNGSLTGSTTVNAGGTLGGTGTVGNVTVASGGTLNPGTSIGTLTVNGNLTFASGSTYQVEADAAGNSDKVVVNGTATLNGNVVALPASGGTYQANTAYTILTSTNALSGQFNSSVSSSLAFLNASLTQDTNNVYLNLKRNDVAYADVANTGNQRAVANALQNASASGGSSADMNTVITTVNNLSADKARAAFESISGGGLVSLRRASTGFTSNFGNQLMGRLQSAGMGSTAQSINGMQLAANDRLGDLMPALAQNTRSDVPASNKFSLGGGVPVDEGKRGFWLRGFGYDQDTDGDGNAAGSRIKGVGITGGFDARVRSDLVVGVAFSHATSDVRATFNETGKSRGNAAAVYTSYVNGPWNVNGNLTLAHNANSMNRNVTVGIISRTANARFDSKTIAAYGEVSYDLPQATWTLQPLAGLGVTHNRNDGFTETGAGVLNIQADAQNITSTRTLFGARSLFDFNGIQVQPRVIWAHELGDVNKAMTAQLQGSPAASFSTYGVDLPRDSLIAGLTVAGRTTDGLSLFADVQGEFNSKQTGVALLVGLRKSW